MSNGDCVEVVNANIGLSQRFSNNRDDRPDVLAARELRHHATIFLVDIELRRYAGR